jgi:hypothetical protein
MSRANERGIFHKQPGLVKLLGNIVIGASSGAISSQSIPGATAARTSTGKYTLTLDDKYQAFLGGHVSILKTTVANCQFQINAASMSTPSVVLDCFTVDRSPNVLVDPVSLTLHVELNVDQSSAART